MRAASGVRAKRWLWLVRLRTCFRGLDCGRGVVVPETWGVAAYMLDGPERVAAAEVVPVCVRPESELRPGVDGKTPGPGVGSCRRLFRPIHIKSSFSSSSPRTRQPPTPSKSRGCACGRELTRLEVDAWRREDLVAWLKVVVEGLAILVDVEALDGVTAVF